MNNINETILGHIAERVADQELEQLKERKVKGDKFVSNVYKARIDKKLLGQNKKNHRIAKLFWCKACCRLMTT